MVTCKLESNNTRIDKMFHRIGLTASNRVGNGIIDTLKQVVDQLHQRSITTVFTPLSANLLELDNVEIQEKSEFGRGLDLVIAVGGDGTMLNAARCIHTHNVPLLGINRGTLGFLADLPAEDIDTHLAKILDGQYVEDTRFLLQTEVVRDDKTILTGIAFNDVIIQKWNIARLVEFDTYINQDFLLTQRSDGMIVSTPTGSTAYALSGGGPILNPSLDAILLVPICPHTLSVRPVVVDGDSVVEIKVGQRPIDQARLTCDGDIVGELEPGDRILVSKSDQLVRLIHPQKHDHFSILRAKLGWGR